MYKQIPSNSSRFYPSANAFIPVGPVEYPYFSSQEEATKLFEQVKKVVPDAELFDGLGIIYTPEFIYGSDGRKFWCIRGTALVGSESYEILENCGILNNQQYSAMWNEGMQPGPNLAVKVEAPNVNGQSGVAAIYWTK